MLELAVGPSRACEMLYSGAMYDAESAARIGLVHEVIRRSANSRSMKRLLRAPVAERMERREALSIDEFVEIWYSAPTRAELETITIRE